MHFSAVQPRARAFALQAMWIETYVKWRICVGVALLDRDVSGCGIMLGLDGECNLVSGHEVEGLGRREKSEELMVVDEKGLSLLSNGCSLARLSIATSLLARIRKLGFCPVFD